VSASALSADLIDLMVADLMVVSDSALYQTLKTNQVLRTNQVQQVPIDRVV
jgi:hypothetical protein